MASTSKIFKKAPIQVQNRSGFDLSHLNLSTLKVGQITPIFVRDMLPNETLSLGIKSTVQLPPMASDFYGTVHIAFESFFVPYRVLFGGWEEMVISTEGQNIDGYIPNKYLPYLSITSREGKYVQDVGPGSLADFLGFKISTTPYIGPEGAQPADIRINNPLRFLAYHKIVNDWYIDGRIQKPIFQRVKQNQVIPLRAANLPYQIPSNPDAPQPMGEFLADDVSIFSLRQRLWPKDYFTNATYEPESSRAVSLKFDVDPNTNTGAFTIYALRAANGVQLWKERNRLVGNKYPDQIYARFGTYPSDAITDRAVFINNQNVQVYNKSVFQTGSADESRSPFNSVGNKFGNSMSLGDFGLIDNFHTTEHGVMMVMATIVPMPIYSTGIARQFNYQSIMDFPDPMLQSVGDQEIYNSELKDASPILGPDSGTFGYTQRFSEAKFKLDEVHGLLRDGEDLSVFALQRSFRTNEITQINTDFIEIPQDYLDQVTAADAAVSRFGAWGEFGITCKLVSPLQPYSIPTLGNPEDTHTEIVDVGGKVIR